MDMAIHHGQIRFGFLGYTSFRQSTGHHRKLTLHRATVHQAHWLNQRLLTTLWPKAPTVVLYWLFTDRVGVGEAFPAQPTLLHRETWRFRKSENSNVGHTLNSVHCICRWLTVCYSTITTYYGSTSAFSQMLAGKLKFILQVRISTYFSRLLQIRVKFLANCTYT